jgi:hypothetical protein
VLHPAAPATRLKSAQGRSNTLCEVRRTDEGRHDPEDARLRCALRQQNRLDPRSQRANPPDGS